jgi:hypothetical protein
MKINQDILKSNILIGKRKRIMSTEAVKSVVAEELADEMFRN